MATTIDIKSLIDEGPISRFQWVIVILRFFVVAADGMDVAIMGFVTPAILQEWDVSRAAFGLVISAAPFGLVIGALMAGPLSDRYGRKVMLTVAVFLFGVFTVAAAQASTPAQMAFLRVLAGIGMGAAMPNTTTLLSEYAPERRRALMITVMFTGFNLGSAAIGFAAGYLIPLYGWRSVLAPGRYPTVARATGVSWMLGMGRFGSIFGSAVGGALLGLGWSFGAILALLAIPAICAALSIALTGMQQVEAAAPVSHAH
jgi:AAHS family 4-hydroxybenzoate transporter-like MFS transporter